MIEDARSVTDHMGPARAVILDFNGTLSDDEPLVCTIFAELFAEHGRPLPRAQYFAQLAGLSDPEIVDIWLGAGHPAADEVLRERVARYRAAVSDGSTVSASVREAVRYAAARVPVVVVSSAFRVEIDDVLAAAGLADAVRAVVSVEDVAETKPAPDPYLRALGLLDGGVRAADVVAFEDTDAGIASAKAAGVRCLAVLGTLPRERLAAADEIVAAIDVPLMRRLLG